MVTSNPHAYFEEQRAALVEDIAVSLEQVLRNINKLNRNLEAVIDVGNEFSSVEALWSQFENVMAKDESEAGDKTGEETSIEARENASTSTRIQDPDADVTMQSQS